MNKIEGKPVTIKVPDSMLVEIERISKKRKMSKSEVYRMMLDLGIQLHKDMERVGVVAAVDFVYYCKQALKAQTDKVAKGKQLTLPL